MLQSKQIESGRPAAAQLSILIPKNAMGTSIKQLGQETIACYDLETEAVQIHPQIIFVSHRTTGDLPQNPFRAWHIELQHYP
jgi:hypothetical protein